MDRSSCPSTRPGVEVLSFGRFVLAVVTFLLVACSTAYAAETAADTGETSVIIAAVLGLLATTSLGTRIIAWAWKHRKILLAVGEILERLATAGDPDSRNAKDQLGALASKSGGEIRDILIDVASRSELKLGKEGSATRTKKDERRSRFLRGLGRWVPIIGAFL
jgi:hypothetical protein